MRVEVPGDELVDLFEKLQEFPGTVPRQALTDHLAGLHIEAANSVVVPLRL
jgi:hypothetical protein